MLKLEMIALSGVVHRVELVPAQIPVDPSRQTVAYSEAQPWKHSVGLFLSYD